MPEATVNHILEELKICGTCFSRCHTNIEQTYLVVGVDGILTTTQATCNTCTCESCRT